MSSSDSIALLVSFAVVAVCVAIYFFPWIIACARGSVNTLGVFLVTLFFGWSCIGYIVAFIWSLTSETKAQQKKRLAKAHEQQQQLIQLQQQNQQLLQQQQMQMQQLQQMQQQQQQMQMQQTNDNNDNHYSSY